MSVVEIVIVAIACTVIVISVAAAAIAAARGTDLLYFERLRESRPSHFRSLVWVCRTNGLLVASMSFVGLIASPQIVFSNEGGAVLRVAVAVAAFLGSALFLWLAIRWCSWGWRMHVS